MGLGADAAIGRKPTSRLEQLLALADEPRGRCTVVLNSSLHANFLHAVDMRKNSNILQYKGLHFS